MSLLDIEGLGVAFEDEDGHPLPAVQNVSFSLEKGAVTCLVGESGCGKSLHTRNSATGRHGCGIRAL